MPDKSLHKPTAAACNEVPETDCAVQDSGNSPGQEDTARQMARLEAQVAAKNARINELETQLTAMEVKAQLAQSELDKIHRSFAWQLVQYIWHFQMRLFPYGTRRRNGLRSALLRIGRLAFKGSAAPPNQETTYQQWIRRNEPDRAQLKKMAQAATKWTYQPIISIVVPIYRTPEKQLREAIESVRSQIYARWELCLADDGSNDSAITRILEDYAAEDQRIRFTQLQHGGGISTATNAAAEIAQGEFIAFLDHDDTLSPDALYRVVELLQKDQEADLIYSDEDKLGSTGERYDVFFKPDWSPDLLLSMNYICHFLVIRRQLFEALGKLRSAFDGSQDYDLVLRAADRTNRIRHIPFVLYHWRASANSTARTPAAKPKAHVAASQAIRDYLDRNQIRAQVEPGVAIGRWRVRYEIIDNPKVAIIIPTGGRLELDKQCLESVVAETAYPNYEIFLVDNSKGSDVERYAKSMRQAYSNLHYMDYRNNPFNYSTLHNWAVRKIEAPLILFLNDDTTVKAREWLAAMVEHGQRPSVGAVGVKLLYPSGTIQHAGVFMGVYENAGHAFKYLPEHTKHYFDFAQVIRNCSAVTAACLLTRRQLFLDLGGFEEAHLPVAFQDVDYCLRLCKAGYHVVYTPHAVMFHHESVSKDRNDKMPKPNELRYMREKWKDVIDHDPYYNPNLSRKYEDYQIRVD